MAYTPTTPTVFDIHFTGTTGAPSVNPYSARGLRGTLTPIAAAQGDDKLARTINGTLISLAAPQFEKYRLEVTGNDQAPPALDGFFVGLVVTVDSLVEIGHMTGDGGPRHAAVPGSERVEGAYSYYAPRMQMRIVSLSIDREEWGAVYGWALTAEEI